MRRTAALSQTRQFTSPNLLIDHICIQHAILLQIVRPRIAPEAASPAGFRRRSIHLMGLVAACLQVPLDPNLGRMPRSGFVKLPEMRQASSPTVPETSILSFTMAMKEFHNGVRNTEKLRDPGASVHNQRIKPQTSDTTSRKSPRQSPTHRQRESPARNPAMLVETLSQGAAQSDDHQGHDDDRQYGV